MAQKPRVPPKIVAQKVQHRETERIPSQPVLNWQNQLAKSAQLKAAPRSKLNHARAPPTAQLKCPFHID